MRRIALLLLVAVGAAPATAQTCTDDRITEFQWTEENDAVAVFSGSDDAYTQGMRFHWTYLKGCAPRWAGDAGSRQLKTVGDRLRAAVYPQAPAADYGYSFEFGQNFFTPNDITKRALIRDDRPYGAWLYGGVGYAIVDDTDVEKVTRQHQFELQAGVVGPAAQGKFIQTEFHRLIHDRLPRGWANQLKTEPGLELFYAFQRRLVVPGSGRHLDFIPSTTAAFGNLQDYVGLGGVLRLGSANMKSFPVSIIACSVNGTEMRERGAFEAFAFIGGEGRAVFRNIFLDGNTFTDSHRVKKEGFVYDLKAGGSVRYRSLRLTYTFVRRSREFSPDPRGVDASRHDYGSVSINWERALGSAE